MAVVGIVLAGVGIFMMYEAYKSSTPTPLKRATAAITGTTTKG